MTWETRVKNLPNGPEEPKGMLDGQDPRPKHDEAINKG